MCKSSRLLRKDSCVCDHCISWQDHMYGSAFRIIVDVMCNPHCLAVLQMAWLPPYSSTDWSHSCYRVLAAMPSAKRSSTAKR